MSKHSISALVKPECLEGFLSTTTFTVEVPRSNAIVIMEDGRAVDKNKNKKVEVPRI
ncbi:hypothetical protein LINGRAHAP2_LOCUS19002 [Linum grandiflorum]